MVAKYLLPGLCFLSCAALGDIMDDFFPGYANPTRSSWQDNFHFSTSDYTFTMANDAIFGSTDRYFTNGVWGSWSDPLDQYVYLTEDNQVHLIEDEALLQDAGIIRNRLKVYGARRNARAWQRLCAEHDPVEWLWQFVGGQPLIRHAATLGEIPAQTAEAKAMSKALQKADFTFVGPTICYAFMQATGMAMDHTTDCHCYPALAGG